MSRTSKVIICTECGQEFEGKLQRADSRCTSCWTENHLETERRWFSNSQKADYNSSASREVRQVVCIDCGKKFETTSTRSGIRCESCSRANKRVLMQAYHDQHNGVSGRGGDMGYKPCSSCGHLFFEEPFVSSKCVTCRDRERPKIVPLAY
jgi:DNA-directed RNA polymerase subunit RPC12/RpoP